MSLAERRSSSKQKDKKTCPARPQTIAHVRRTRKRSRIQDAKGKMGHHPKDFGERKAIEEKEPIPCTGRGAVVCWSCGGGKREGPGSPRKRCPGS